MIDLAQRLHPVLTVRIFGEEKIFGPGVARLLRQVEKCRSLRGAAKAMGMAYSKAWTITKNAEAGLGFPLLQRRTGGRNGGGAALTPEAERLLEAYDRYCGRLRVFAQETFEEEFSFPDGK